MLKMYVLIVQIVLETFETLAYSLIVIVDSVVYIILSFNYYKSVLYLLFPFLNSLFIRSY